MTPEQAQTLVNAAIHAATSLRVLMLLAVTMAAVWVIRWFVEISVGRR